MSGRDAKVIHLHDDRDGRPLSVEEMDSVARMLDAGDWPAAGISGMGASRTPELTLRAKATTHIASSAIDSYFRSAAN